MGRENKKRRVGRPFWGWTFGLTAVLYPWYRLRYGLHVDKEALEDMRGPAVVLAPHVCPRDHFLVLFALWRHCPNFVASAHLFAKPRLGWILKKLHVIPKRMFCADPCAIRDMLRAAGEGNVIVMFPEGRLPACGHSLPVAAGTAELVKRIGADVYTVTANGGYLSFPKWGYPRRGEIHVTSKQLFSAQQLQDMPTDMVRAEIEAAMVHDDERAMPGVRYRTGDTTAGLDGILRVCPQCRRRGSLVTGGGHIRCACGLDAVLDEYWQLSGAPYHTVNEWYDAQQKEIDPMRYCVSCEVAVSALGKDGCMERDIGHGAATLDKHGFSFVGEMRGTAVSYAVPMAVLGGIPVTPGDHFDIYHAGTMYHFRPTPDPRAAIDFVQYLDRYKSLQAAEESRER